MRKTWLFALAVVIVGALAGVAIAGRPEPVDPFVLHSNVSVPIETSPTSQAASTTTTSLAPTATTASSTPAAAPTTAPIPATTTSTTEAPTTTETTTTTTIAGPLPRDQVRLVLANGDGRFRLSSITAERISPLGYIIDLGDALHTVDATIIYYRPGFDDEAEVVANDIKVPGAIIAALPTSPAPSITNSDDSGDVIVVLGPDAPR
ncbi:MAG: hypothetical protein QOH53_2308 [Ilumatobacteraceae bacterium]